MPPIISAFMPFIVFALIYYLACKGVNALNAFLRDSRFTEEGIEVVRFGGSRVAFRIPRSKIRNAVIIGPFSPQMFNLHNKNYANRGYSKAILVNTTEGLSYIFSPKHPVAALEALNLPSVSKKTESLSSFHHRDQADERLAQVFHMSRSVRLALGVLTVSTTTFGLCLFALQAYYMARMGDQGWKRVEHQHLLLIHSYYVLSVGLLLFYLIHALKKTVLTSSARKREWLVLVMAINILFWPFYWYQFIWKEN